MKKADDQFLAIASTAVLASEHFPSMTTGGMAYVAMLDRTILSDTLERLNGTFDKLITATNTFHTTLLELINSNAALIARVATLNSILAALSINYTILASGNHAPFATATTETATNRPPQIHNLSPNGFFWTNGYRVGTDNNACPAPSQHLATTAYGPHSPQPPPLNLPLHSLHSSHACTGHIAPAFTSSPKVLANSETQTAPRPPSPRQVSLSLTPMAFPYSFARVAPLAQACEKLTNDHNHRLTCS